MSQPNPFSEKLCLLGYFAATSGQETEAPTLELLAGLYRDLLALAVSRAMGTASLLPTYAMYIAQGTELWNETVGATSDRCSDRIRYTIIGVFTLGAFV